MTFRARWVARIVSTLPLFWTYSFTQPIFTEPLTVPGLFWAPDTVLWAHDKSQGPPESALRGSRPREAGSLRQRVAQAGRRCRAEPGHSPTLTPFVTSGKWPCLPEEVTSSVKRGDGQGGAEEGSGREQESPPPARSGLRAPAAQCACHRG